jgi:hypothetical protein
MEVTKQPPFTVLEVDNLMDEHYILQGHAGYSNEHVKRGDKLLRVDGTRVESVTVKHLHELLGGDKHSLAELSFARAQGGEEYTIRVRRHGRHEHECKPADANGSITHAEDTCAPSGASAYKTPIVPAVPASSTVSSKVSSKIAQTQMAPLAVSEEAGDEAAAAAGAGGDAAAAAAERRPTGKRDGDPSNAQASASASAAEKEQGAQAADAAAAAAAAAAASCGKGAMRGAGASLKHTHEGPALAAGILTYAAVCCRTLPYADVC